MNDPIQKGKITIAIPTVNRQDFLPLTIQSAILQSYSDIEILISNNASTDNTDVVLEQFLDARIRKFKQTVRLDMVANWNFCLSKAVGEWFIILSDDDLLAPFALEELLRPLVDNHASMSYTPFITIDGFGVEGFRSRSGPALSPGTSFIHEHLSRKRMVMPSGVLGRTELLRALGGFPEIGTTSDLGLRLLMATSGPVACTQTPLLRYRVHGGNLSGQSTAVVASHLSFENWAHGKGELAPYRKAISTYVWRGITGYGLRSALVGDKEGTSISLVAFETIGVSSWRKWIARCAIWSGQTRPFRVLISIRDKYMKLLSPRG